MSSCRLGKAGAEGGFTYQHSSFDLFWKTDLNDHGLAEMS